MAGKGSQKERKNSKKPGKKEKRKELALNTFGYEILSYVLPLCGFPEEKIQRRERKPDQEDNVCVRAIVLTVALSKRDVWKIMLESRSKGSGFDTTEKIEECMNRLLKVTPEFRNCNTNGKMHISLAAYSEVMLFFNYKRIEFDFEVMLNLWTRHYLEIDIQPPNEGEFLDQFFTLFDPFKFFEWFSSFLKKSATPYGSTDGISKMFLQRVAEQKEENDQQNWKLAEMLASQVPSEAPDLPEGFESAAVLPGDRVSPEPPESSESSVPEGEKKSRSRGRSTGLSEGVSEGRRRKCTAPELGITDRLGQMSLSSETSPQDTENRRKPKDRKSR